MPMTREEHMAWCKKRALEYVDAGDLDQAIVSMLSDLRKHPETQDSGGGILAALAIREAQHGTPHSVRKFINGFN